MSRVNGERHANAPVSALDAGGRIFTSRASVSPRARSIITGLSRSDGIRRTPAAGQDSLGSRVAAESASESATARPSATAGPRVGTVDSAACGFAVRSASVNVEPVCSTKPVMAPTPTLNLKSPAHWPTFSTNAGSGRNGSPDPARSPEERTALQPSHGCHDDRQERQERRRQFSVARIGSRRRTADLREILIPLRGMAKWGCDRAAEPRLRPFNSTSSGARPAPSGSSLPWR